MNINRSVAVAAVTCLLTTPSAHAYLDPGTGSLIIQGAIAAVGAVLVGGRMYWTRIKSWFRGASSTPQSVVPPSTIEEDVEQHEAKGARRESQE